MIPPTDPLLSIPDGLRVWAVLVFVAAAVFDVRTRRVPNAWIVLALVFAATAAFFDTTLSMAAASGVLLAILGVSGWYAGALGGADAKALPVVGVLYPAVGVLAVVVAFVSALVVARVRGECPFYAVLAPVLVVVLVV